MFTHEEELREFETDSNAAIPAASTVNTAVDQQECLYYPNYFLITIINISLPEIH